MAETNIADTLVEYLSSRGVQNIFGVLAHTSFAIGDAIAKRPHMRFVNAQHEGGAGNMALGYARATKKPAVCLVSAGGGATNIVTAVAQAHKESVPLFVISSDIDTAASAKGSFSSFHGMEHVRLFQPITKQSVKLERVEELGKIYNDIQNELRSQYVLGFYPPEGVKPGSKWREVQVQTSQGKVKTIRGYYP